MKHENIILLWLTGLLLMLFLSCSRDNSRLRVGIIRPSIDHLPLSYAQKKGYLDPTGWEKLEFSSGWEVQEALSSGRIDLAIMPFTYAWTAVSKGYKLKIISCLERETDGIITPAEIDSIKELNGKKIGLLRASTLEVLMLDTARYHHIDYEPVYFRTPSELTAALQSREVNAIVSYVPLIQKLGAEYHVLSWFADRHPHHPCCDLVAAESALRNKGRKVRMVKNALLKATDDINNRTEETFILLEKLYGLNREQAADALLHTQFDLKLTDADMMFERRMMESFLDQEYVQSLPADHDIFAQ
jgi:ABC-type nitrate/sulfonate/bicarbonate transport system substrate-binding protein